MIADYCLEFGSDYQQSNFGHTCLYIELNDKAKMSPHSLQPLVASEVAGINALPQCLNSCSDPKP